MCAPNRARALMAEPVPAPSGDPVTPSHLAILLALTPPATVNPPPAYRVPLSTSSALAGLLRPVLKGDQVLPFQRAMLVAFTPPAWLKDPLTIKSLLPMTAMALTFGVPNCR